MINFYQNPGTRVDLLLKTRAFLADYLKWVERGAPNCRPYSRRVGLCLNAIDFVGGWTIREDLSRVFRENADEDSDQAVCPFGVKEYFSSNDLHTCPRRLAFVRANI